MIYVIDCKCINFRLAKKQVFFIVFKLIKLIFAVHFKNNKYVRNCKKSYRYNS